MTNNDQTAYRWFRSRGYGASLALALAKAERQAEERGVSFQWTYDDDFDREAWDAEDLARFQRMGEYPRCLEMFDWQGQFLDHLCGVDIAISDTRERHAVVRCFEAEMALNLPPESLRDVLEREAHNGDAVAVAALADYLEENGLSA